jgi:cell division protein FtsB
MKELLERRYVLRQNWVTILGAVLCLYFSYHLIQGDRSYGRLIGLEQAITRDTQSYDNLLAEREKLEHRVEMLRPGSINPDYLEERARYMLGYRTESERDLLMPR